MPIFDQGYQHWSGTLAGHTWRWLTITRHGIRVGMKNRLLRIVVIVSWLPAVGLAAMLCLWGLLENKSPLALPFVPFLRGLFSPDMVQEPLKYRVDAWTLSFYTFLKVELYFAMIVVLLVGPGLISQDLRFNALPLYFSRPLRRIDYFAGKLGVIAWFLGLVIIFPSLIAYVFGLAFSLDVTILRDTFYVLLTCLVYGAIIMLSAGTLILALSALSRNSRYVALFWVALWFVSSIIAAILGEVDEAQRRSEYYRNQDRMAYPNQPPMDRPLTREEGEQLIAQRKAWEEASRKAEEGYQADEKRAAERNWRPLVSYTGNLLRLGEQMLGTNAIWIKLSEREPDQQREYYLREHLGPQYPWYWSALVLAVLFGLSACLLNYRVRSLDRLK